MYDSSEKLGSEARDARLSSRSRFPVAMSPNWSAFPSRLTARD